MKLAYIYFNAGTGISSVQKKITGQINALRKLNADIEGVFFSSEVSEITRMNDQVNLIPVQVHIKGYFPSIQRKKQFAKAFTTWLDTNGEKYDAFFIRYPYGSRTFYKLASKWGYKFITEHQTIEYLEIRNLYASNPFGLNPSKLLSWFEYFLHPLLTERFWGPCILSKLKAVCGVTNEIAQFEVERSIGDKPEIIINSNGVILDGIEVRKAPEYNGSELRLLMLIGSSSASDWNGIDRLLKGIENYNGPTIIKLNLCGQIVDRAILEHPSVEYKGFVQGEELQALASNCHLGVGTLALHRKGLTEACALKMREYAAMGIPAVYAYYDQDFEVLCNQNLALKLSDDDSPIDMPQVIKFASNVLGDSGHPEKIRNIAETGFSQEVKMKYLLNQVVRIFK